MRRSVLASLRSRSSPAVRRGPQPAPTRSQQPVQVTPRRSAQTGLAGLTAQELVGNSAGPRCRSAKAPASSCSSAGTRCVLDAYLYPSASGRRCA